MFRAGIIGVGAIGAKQDENKRNPGIYSHAGAYRFVDEINLTAACDVDPVRLKTFGKFWKIDKLYKEVDDFLAHEDDMELVSICTPDYTHFPILVKLLSRSHKIKAVIVEKPVAQTLQQCAAIEGLLEKSNILIEVNNHRRVEPAHLRVAQLIREETAGSVQAVSGYYVRGLFHNGCTMVNTLRMFLGEVEWVRALHPFEAGSYGTDCSIDFILGFKKNIKAIVQACDKKTYSYSIFEIDILCENFRFRIVDNGFTVKQYTVEPYSHYPGFSMLCERDKIVGDMAHGLVYLYRNILNDIKKEKTGWGDMARDAIKDIAILEAINDSACQNGVKIIMKHNEF